MIDRKPPFDPLLRAYLDHALRRMGKGKRNREAEQTLIDGLAEDISNLHKPPGIKATLIRPGPPAGD